MRTCNGTVIPRDCAFSLANFYVPAPGAHVASMFNCHPQEEETRCNLSVGICMNSAVHTTFSKGMHIIGGRNHHKCNGCIIVHRSGNLRAICKRLSGRLISAGRLMGTNRPVTLKKGAKHSANSRLRFRAHFLNVPVGPTLVFSFRGRSVMTSSCAFRGAGNSSNATHDVTSNRNLFCGMGGKSALKQVTTHRKASVSGLYGLGEVAHGAVLEPKRMLHYSWGHGRSL